MKEVFWVTAGDVFAPEFDFSPSSYERFITSTALAHIWLVPNPPHNPQGDVGWGLVDTRGAQASTLALNVPADSLEARYTYSTIGLYRCALFAPPWCSIAPGNPQGVKAPLAPLLRAAMDQGRVSASLYTDLWTDVGTPERLHAINDSSTLKSSPL